ncbi:folate-binding protein [Shimia sp.]|uniref:CAF17-like 4Fe-4S cluster assembly/insertion protein YgfZ n=1 Tax=Shimia sp. TaxID=1954381 RepID=UPI00329A76FB
MTRSRTLFRLSGADTDRFLQGLITNDMDHLTDGLLYAALLTPQGKYIADFFLTRDGSDVLLDADTEQAPALVARLSMFKLRADVTITPTDLHMHRGTGPSPADGFSDPRCAALGWRAYRDSPQTDDTTDWDALRVAHAIPEAGVELAQDSYILEQDFERLNGVDFRKGCYVGQEVTARMKHKTELRKGLALVEVTGRAPSGTPIMRAAKEVGTLFTQSNGKALAYLRFDRAGEGMKAADAEVSFSR